MNRDVLLSALTARFPGRQFRVAPQGDVVSPGDHPDVGGLTFIDDGDEWVVHVGDITHAHLRSREEVIEFLEWLFADRVLMWKVWTGGGWRLEPAPVTSFGRKFSLRRWYVWSKPLPR